MPKKPETDEVVDSWEDEDTSDIGETANATTDRTDTTSSNANDDGDGNSHVEPLAMSRAEETPSSRKINDAEAVGVYSPDGTLLKSSSGYTGSGFVGRVQDKRPEKTDAVARRMIASALGVRPNRRTEEERAYDNALKEKEKRRRDEERARRAAEEAAAEKEKEDMWGS